MPDWTPQRDDDATPAQKVGTDKPHVARMYDYALGGKDHFETDRAATEKAMSVVPDARNVAIANREFMVRAVGAMADSGIDQFIDLGTGYPASPNVHEVARERQPGAQIVYVDNDPVVVAHNRALRKGPNVLAIEGDIRDPHEILADPELKQAIDFTRPVGVLFISVLHLVPDDFDPATVVATFLRQVPSGSMLAISHPSSDGLPADVMHTIETVYASGPTPFTFRNGTEIEALFGGYPLLPPGLVDVSQWRPNDHTTRHKSTMRILCGVTQVP